ncbi:MAG: Esterase [Actinomycetia bacterium]|nr:Esterase [Actinomycetes bacterium]
MGGFRRTRRLVAFIAIAATPVLQVLPTHSTTSAVAAAPSVLIYGDSVVDSGAFQIAQQVASTGWAPRIVAFPGADIGQIAGNVMSEPNMSDVVVLGVGYTYFWKPTVLHQQIEATMRALAARGVRRVIWLNVRENRAERRDVNLAIAAAAREWGNIDVADWNDVSSRDVAAFQPDGFHLSATGGTLMGYVIAGRLAAYRSGAPPSMGPAYGARASMRPLVNSYGNPDASVAAVHAGVNVRRSPFVGIASTKSGRGAWVALRDGGIVLVGDARSHGSLVGIALRAPVVGIAATPSGNGYWMVASDGGVFAFGDARFRGSTGAIRLAQPVVGIAATPTGKGYWMVASDGGVFSFGDARFFGSTGAMTLEQPVVGIAAHPSGRGYWLVAYDGGIFTFGAARFHGSGADIWRYWKIEGMAPTPDGNGYWLLAASGDVMPYGSARVAAIVRRMRELFVAIAPRPGGGVWTLGEGPA